MRTQLERARRGGDGQLLPLSVRWSLDDLNVKAPHRSVRDYTDVAGLKLIFEDDAVLEHVRQLDLNLDKDRLDICFFSWNGRRMSTLESLRLSYSLPYQMDSGAGNADADDDSTLR